MHYFSTRRFFPIVPAIALIAAAGCGSANAPEHPALFATGGTVTLDGKPLAGASVAFVPTGETKGQSCVGVTDQSGAFSLETMIGDANQLGAAAGQFKVVISLPDQASSAGTNDPSGLGAADAGGPGSIPAKYSDFLATELTATIPEGGTKDLKFDLTSR